MSVGCASLLSIGASSLVALAIAVSAALMRK